MVVHRTAGMEFGMTTTLNDAKTLSLKFKLMCTSKINKISLYFNELIKTCQ